MARRTAPADLGAYGPQPVALIVERGPLAAHASSGPLLESKPGSLLQSVKGGAGPGVPAPRRSAPLQSGHATVRAGSWGRLVRTRGDVPRAAQVSALRKALEYRSLLATSRTHDAAHPDHWLRLGHGTPLEEAFSSQFNEMTLAAAEAKFVAFIRETEGNPAERLKGTPLEASLGKNDAPSPSESVVPEDAESTAPADF